MADDKINKLSQIGSTGLEHYDGRIYEEFLPTLRGMKSVKIYQEMQHNDPIVGAILFAVEMLIRQVEFRVQPASDNSADVEMAEFVESCMDDMDMTWQETISEIISMLVYGWSYHEIVYKVRKGNNKDVDKMSRFDDGKIGWGKLPIRSQDTLYKWAFDDNGGIVGMWQQAPPRWELVFIPMEKALLFRTSSVKNNPEGRSVLRNAYRPWYFKKRIEEIEGIGIERDLAGLPVAFVPPDIMADDASPQEKAVFNSVKDIVRNVRRDEQEGVVFPAIYDDNGNKLYDFQLMSTGGSRQFDTDAIINRYDQRIAMTILADFILLGHEGVGSFALSSTKTHLFSVALGAWLNSIVSVFNRFAIPRLFKLNGFKVENLPKLVCGDIESIPLTELGEYISKLSGAGVDLFPDDELKKYLLKIANLPVSEV